MTGNEPIVRRIVTREEQKVLMQPDCIFHFLREHRIQWAIYCWGNTVDRYTYSQQLHNVVFDAYEGMYEPKMKLVTFKNKKRKGIGRC